MKNNFKKIIAGLLIASSFIAVSVAFADAYDPIVNFRNSDDTADTSAHIVGLDTTNFAVYGDRLNTPGAPSAYYFDTSAFNIQTAAVGFGSSNYKINLNLGNSNPCDLGNLCDLLATKSRAYEGTTLRSNSFPIFKTATVASGVAVFYLTTDGTSSGTALFSNGIIQSSIQLIVNDASASYQYGWALTNGNKTLTVTTNKLSTANILTGVLGQSAANGSVVNLTVYGY